MTDTPWKTDGWHTSPWNFDPEVTKDWKFPENIRIHDVTLRDGEQQAGLAYNYDDKIRIAEGLAEIGVHRIEAGMPVVSPDDAKVVAELAKRDFEGRLLNVLLGLYRECNHYQAGGPSAASYPAFKRR